MGVNSQAYVGAPDNVTIGTTSTAVLTADLKREAVVLTNISDEVIDVAVGAAAVANKGIRLAASAGQIALTPEMGCRLAINAICASGTKVLSTQTMSRS